MRGLFLFLPAVLMAQTPAPQPAAPKAPAKTAPSTPSPSTPKAGTTTKSGTATKAGTTPAPKKAAPAAPAAGTAMTDEQKTIYALGLALYRNLAQFDLSPAELDLVKKAISDASAGKPAVEVDTWMPKIQGLAQARAAKGAEKEKAASVAYLAKCAA